MTLIADVVTVVIGSPAPVLFLDSCILLDIVRAPPAKQAERDPVCSPLPDRGAEYAKDNSPPRRLPDPEGVD